MMMGIKNSIDKFQIKICSLDNLVPEEHLARKLEKAIDLTFIHELVIDFYPLNRKKYRPHRIDKTQELFFENFSNNIFIFKEAI